MLRRLSLVVKSPPPSGFPGRRLSTQSLTVRHRWGSLQSGSSVGMASALALRSWRHLGQHLNGRVSSGVLRRSFASQPFQLNMEEPKPGECLKQFTRDLTEIAKNGKLDPIIGRDDEIARAIQILSRRTKNNPILIGDPGVGKTAIVEGLAQRIVAGEVPDSIKNKKLLALDLAALISGTQFRGSFESRFKSLLKDAETLGNEIILFADEVHQLVGMGQVGEGGMDASNLLKPALARGEIRFIGATTLDEYRKYIEKDQALTRRFQSVYVSEPTVDETIAILRGLKEKYEVHHGIRIKDAAVVAASQYSQRYLTERKLPDKAIDLLDEATSRLRMRSESKPDDLAHLERELVTLRIEQAALSKETDIKSIERKEKVEAKMRTKQAEFEKLNEVWQAERERRKEIQNAQERLEEAKQELARAQMKGDFTKAGELKYVTIPKYEKLVKERADPTSQLEKDFVDEDDIAEVVAYMTGIPVNRLLKSERERLLKMEDGLSKRVVGQDHALEAVSDAIRISRAGLHSHTKPIGSFLFLGPTGVGKTELAKALAEFMFSDENAIVRIDMSEFGLQHSVARLIGAPPGYVGYGEGGSLTEPIRRRPYQVVLLDEVEKAHRDVTNILLQVLDDGHLTDGNGRKVDFRNTVIIMTSNLGSDLLDAERDHSTLERDNQLVMQAVKAHFPPEFINRLDASILFNHLKLKDMAPIARIQLKKVENMLWEDRRIRLKLNDDVINDLSVKGYDPAYGARPLKRVIQTYLLNPLSRCLLAGDVKDGGEILVSLSSDPEEFQIETVNPIEEVGK